MPPRKMTDEELARFIVRRDRIVEAINKLGRGARAQCARDTVTSPTTLTGVLTGHYMSNNILDRIENWLEGRSCSSS